MAFSNSRLWLEECCFPKSTMPSPKSHRQVRFYKTMDTDIFWIDCVLTTMGLGKLKKTSKKLNSNIYWVFFSYQHWGEWNTIVYGFKFSMYVCIHISEETIYHEQVGILHDHQGLTKDSQKYFFNIPSTGFSSWTDSGTSVAGLAKHWPRWTGMHRKPLLSCSMTWPHHGAGKRKLPDYLSP